MRFFIANFKWIMLISGLLTCSMFLGLFSPQSSLKSNFGEELVEGAGNIIVRNWSALIGLMGIMLIYGAFKPAVRKFSLIIAGISKVIFIALVLSLGKQYMGFGVGTAVVVDAVMIFLFIVYLIFSRSTKDA
jgi:phage-related minor tail protein